jgi:hypothetical protein
MSCSQFVRRHILVATVAAIVSLGVAPSFGVEVLDQSFFGPTVGSEVLTAYSGSLYRAQVFTVGRTGQLTRVEAYFSRNGSSTFEIWSTVDGVPEEIPSAALASGTIAYDGDGFVGVDLSDDNLNVTAGDVLALVEVGGTSTGIGIWKGLITGTYNGGDAFTTLTPNSSGEWVQEPWDLYFKSYVTVPEPGALALVMGGLPVLLVLLRRPR